MAKLKWCKLPELKMGYGTSTKGMKDCWSVEGREVTVNVKGACTEENEGE